MPIATHQLSLVNQHFETGDTTGWVQEIASLSGTSWGVGTAGSPYAPLSPKDGDYYLWMTSRLILSQTVEIPIELWNVVDEGRAWVEAEYWVAHAGSDAYNSAYTANGVLELEGKDSVGQLVTCGAIGRRRFRPDPLPSAGVAQGTWVSRTTKRFLPPGTRQVSVVLDTNVSSPSSSFVFAVDAVELFLREEAAAITLANQDFVNLLSGWSVFGAAGRFVSTATVNPTPLRGSLAVYALSGSAASLFQVVQLPSSWLSAIDNGDVNVTFPFHFGADEARTQKRPRTYIRFLNSFGTEITTSEQVLVRTSMYPGDNWNAYQPAEHSALIPSGTRYIEVGLSVYDNRTYYDFTGPLVFSSGDPSITNEVDSPRTFSLSNEPLDVSTSEFSRGKITTQSPQLIQWRGSRTNGAGATSTSFNNIEPPADIQYGDHMFALVYSRSELVSWTDGWDVVYKSSPAMYNASEQYLYVFKRLSPVTQEEADAFSKPANMRFSATQTISDRISGAVFAVYCENGEVTVKGIVENVISTTVTNSINVPLMSSDSINELMLVVAGTYIAGTSSTNIPAPPADTTQWTTTGANVRLASAYKRLEKWASVSGAYSWPFTAAANAMNALAIGLTPASIEGNSRARSPLDPHRYLTAPADFRGQAAAPGVLGRPTVRATPYPAALLVGANQYYSASGTAMTGAMPAGIQNDDSVLAFVVTRNATLSLPGGWTEISTGQVVTPTNTFRGYILQKNSVTSADSSQSVTFTASASVPKQLAYVVVRGSKYKPVISQAQTHTTYGLSSESPFPLDRGVRSRGAYEYHVAVLLLPLLSSDMPSPDESTPLWPQLFSNNNLMGWGSTKNTDEAVASHVWGFDASTQAAIAFSVSFVDNPPAVANVYAPRVIGDLRAAGSAMDVSGGAYSISPLLAKPINAWAFVGAPSGTIFATDNAAFEDFIVGQKVWTLNESTLAFWHLTDMSRTWSLVDTGPVMSENTELGVVINHILSEMASLSPRARFIVAAFLSDSLDLIDSPQELIRRVLTAAETIRILEGIQPNVTLGVTFSEGFNVRDHIAFIVAKEALDTFVAGDSIGETVRRVFFALDNVRVGDLIGTAIQFLFQIIEGVTTSDSSRFALGLVLEELLEAADTTAYDMGILAAALENFRGSDQANLALQLGFEAIDNLSASDSVAWVAWVLVLEELGLLDEAVLETKVILSCLDALSAITPTYLAVQLLGALTDGGSFSTLIRFGVRIASEETLDLTDTAPLDYADLAAAIESFALSESAQTAVEVLIALLEAPVIGEALRIRLATSLEDTFEAIEESDGLILRLLHAYDMIRCQVASGYDAILNLNLNDNVLATDFLRSLIAAEAEDAFDVTTDASFVLVNLFMALDGVSFSQATSQQLAAYEEMVETLTLKDLVSVFDELFAVDALSLEAESIPFARLLLRAVSQVRALDSNLVSLLLSISASEAAALGDLMRLFITLGLDETSDFADVSDWSLRHVVAALSRLEVVSHTSTTLLLAASLFEQLLSVDFASVVQGMSAEEIVELSDNLVNVIRARISSSEALNLVDEIQREIYVLGRLGESINVGDTIGVNIRAWLEGKEGMLFVGLLPIDGEEYQAWAINTDSLGVTQYTNFPFDGLETHKGRTFGLTPSGLYELEGDTDEGAPIEAMIRTGMLDFGSSHLKSMPRAFLYLSSNNDVYLATESEKRGIKERNVYTIQPLEQYDQQLRRVKLGREVRGNRWAFEIGNVDGGALDLDSFEVIPMTLAKRW